MVEALVKNKPLFVTEADIVPTFWNFVAGLNTEDLIAELVQNDLDQDATRTVVSFERDRLVCEGNGRPVDEDGWLRLRMIQGAGTKVRAKQGKIGVKNHGLKTAFTIGDQLRVMSSGQSITQTLYANGWNEPPHPGASSHPEPDPDAPTGGCRLVISYRSKSLEVREGENVSLKAMETDAIDNLFLLACANVPEQFAGIVSPESVLRYEVLLRHWRLGEARFLFSCGRPSKIAKSSIEVFYRRCNVSGTISSPPSGWREETARRFLPLQGRLKERLPDFYRRGNRYFVEASWPVDSRGKPKKGIGQFRYPIGYPPGSHEARTGHGASFNAPFVSDPERHGPARSDPTYEELREECEKLLVDTIARHVVKKWGANALEPLVPSLVSDNEERAVRPLLAELARQDAMPTVDHLSAARILLRGRKAKEQANWNKALRRGRTTSEARRYKFIMPVATWAKTSVYTSLAMVAPPEERQLDPRVDPEILRLLADGATDGFGEVFVTFDENDARDRAMGEGNAYFAVSRQRHRELAHPFAARAYLDIINDAVDRSQWSTEEEEELKAGLLLPDTELKAVPFADLHASARVPVDVPGLRLPPLLHPQIASHSLLRRTKWSRPRYSLTEFLNGGTLQEAGEQTRAHFWQWLRLNERRVQPSARAMLAQIAIWPDTDGVGRNLSELCEPRSARVAAALGKSIHRPHEQARRLSIVTLGKRGRLSIRRNPSKDELQDWFNRRTEKVPVGSVATADVENELESFETDLAVLLKSKQIARDLGSLEVILPALAQDGFVRRRSDLLPTNKKVKRLDLPTRFLLKNSGRAAVLDKLSSTLSEPDVSMLVAAFEEDNANFDALQPRLQLLLDLTRPDDEARNRVANMAILPLEGQPRVPRDLAFKGSRGDYWGLWKTQMHATGLSQDAQVRYRKIGVTPSVPSTETSRDFFKWLSKQDSETLNRHLGCVVRHVRHENGPRAWAQTYTDTPFIPARGHRGPQLASLQHARRRPLFLPDLPEIVEQVLETDEHVLIAVDKIREVREPIADTLRKLGVRSLREAIGEPDRVTARESVWEVPEEMLETLKALRSPKVRRTLLKRLDEMGVETELVRHDWHDRVSRISSIKFALDIEAQYRFRRKRYRIPVDAGFDPHSGTFWIKDERRDALNGFLETLAAQLIFKPSARRMHLLALAPALALEINEISIGRSAAWEVDQEEDGDDHGNGIDQDRNNTGEAVRGHAPFTPNPAQNIPNPASLSSRANTKANSGEGNRGGSTKTGAGDGNGRTPALEQVHKEELKAEHYASHCQMCLCDRSPLELAPPGSYAEWQELRRLIVHAHHLDPKSGSGARHAGNLTLLCKLHHDNYGRRLTREALTTALRKRPVRKTVRFAADGGQESEVTGRVVRVVIPDNGEAVSLFFTEEHAHYWLSEAPSTNVTIEG